MPFAGVYIGVDGGAIGRSSSKNEGYFVLEEYRKQSDTVREFVQKLKEADERCQKKYGEGIGFTEIKELADALIANGYGDVAEWKEKYEKMSLVTKLYSNAGTTEIERLTRERDEYKRRAEVAESERDEYRHCSEVINKRLDNAINLAKEITQQVEREIEEEERK